MYARIERRECPFCGEETPHRIERVGRISDKHLDIPIVKNTVTCCKCNAIYTERRIIVAK